MPVKLWTRLLMTVSGVFDVWVHEKDMQFHLGKSEQICDN